MGQNKSGTILNFKLPLLKVIDKINLGTLKTAPAFVVCMNISPSLTYHGLLAQHEPGAGTYEYWSALQSYFGMSSQSENLRHHLPQGRRVKIGSMHISAA